MPSAAPRRVQVRLREASYPIIIGFHLEQELVRAVEREGKRRIAIIADSTTRELFGKRIAGLLKKAGRDVVLVSFPAGEKHKTEKTISSLHHALLKKRFGRDSLILALGGGVVGDVAGYVAATFLRGVPYIQVPTTLLAIIDSSVGGKVGVDTPHGKNLIGAFHQPRAVIADLAWVSSLKKRQVVNGLIEALKKFTTSEKRSLALIAKLDLAQPLRTPRVLQDIAYRSVYLKARVVMRDEEEKNERRILNFGHTIGHALEFVSNYKLPHGYAVGYGMLVEARIAEELGLLKARDRKTLEANLARLGITADDLKKYSISKVLRAARGDKKARGKIPHYVLLTSIGSIYKKGGEYAHPVQERIVRKAYERLLSDANGRTSYIQGIYEVRRKRAILY